MTRGRENKIKLLHLITTFSVGGAEMHLLSLIRGLLATGDYHITVAFFKEAAEEARSLVPDFRALGIEVVDLRMRARMDIFALIRLYKLLRITKPDIVHTHLFRADLFGPLVAKLTGIPVVLSSVHNVESFYQNPLVQIALRTSYRLCDYIITISDAVKLPLVNSVRVPASKLRRIHYGLDWTPSEIENAERLRMEYGFTDKDIVIGTVGRFVEQKGHRYLIESFAHIRQKVPQAKLLIVGQGKELRKELGLLISRLRLENDVVLTGYKDNIPALMHAIDLFALPSLWEGLGLVLLEAMAAGKPVVASAVDAIPEIVVDGTTGFLVPAKDSVALADAISCVLLEPVLWQKFGEAGRARVRENFTSRSMVEKTCQVYEAALRKHTEK